VQGGQTCTWTLINGGTCDAYGVSLTTYFDGSWGGSSWTSGSPLHPGGSGTVTHTISSSGWISVSYNDCNSGGTFHSDVGYGTWVVTAGGSGSGTWYIYPGGVYAGGPPTNYCSTVSVININTVTRYYQPRANGVAQGPPVSLDPGATLNFRICQTNGPVTATVDALTSEGAVQSTYTGSNTNYPSMDGYVDGVAAPTATLQGLGGLDPGVGVYATNFFPGTGSNGCQCCGQFVTLYNALATTGGQLASDIANSAAALHAQLASGLSNFGPITVSLAVTNNLTAYITNLNTFSQTNFFNLTNLAPLVFVTNSTDMAGLSNVLDGDLNRLLAALTNGNGSEGNVLSNSLGGILAVSNLLVAGNVTALAVSNLMAGGNLTAAGISNLSAAGNVTSVGISNALANVSNTMSEALSGVLNGYSNQASGGPQILGAVPDFATNGSAAMAAAMTLISGVDGALASATGLVGTAESSVGSAFTGAGSASALSFAFCGRTLNLDPEVRFPGLMGLVKAAWTFIALMLFCRWAAAWLVTVLKVFSGAQTGGVPDLNEELAGFGGNIAGLIVAKVVAGVFIGLWVVVFDVVVGMVMDKLGMLPSSAGALGLGGNQGALYLLNASFPVSLVISLGMARITLPLTAAKLGWAAAAASRYLFGR
jgi:hypothetical protein